MSGQPLERQQPEPVPPGPPANRTAVKLETAVRWSIVGGFVLAIVYTLYFARSFLVPIFVALFLATLLRPFVSRLGRLGVPDPIAAAIVVPLFLGIVGYGAVQLSAPALDWLDRAPILIRQIDLKLEALRESIDAARDASARLQEMTILSNGERVPEDGGDIVVVQGPSLGEQMLSSAQSTAVGLAVAVVLLYLILAFGGDTVNRLRDAIADGRVRGEVTTVLAQLQQEISTYLRTITLINIVLGALTALAMALLGMPTPVLWGAVAGLLNFLPFVGPALALAILAVVALLSFNTLPTILAPPLVYGVLHVLEGSFITPMIVGYRLTLNPLVVVLAFLFWGWIWGPVGVLLAVPLLVGLKVVVGNREPLKPLRALLG